MLFRASLFLFVLSLRKVFLSRLKNFSSRMIKFSSRTRLILYRISNILSKLLNSFQGYFSSYLGYTSSYIEKAVGQMKNHPPHIIKTKSHLFSNADVQFLQLCLIYLRRRIYHHISSAVVFRESDVVTDNLVTI